MTHQKTRLFHNRSSIKEFLLYKTDANPKKDTPEVLSSVVTNRILKAFPDIPVGKTFIENAMARFETIEKFESMVIKIDSLNHEGSETAGNDQIDLWLNVANVIDTICRRENGMWGAPEISGKTRRWRRLYRLSIFPSSRHLRISFPASHSQSQVTGDQHFARKHPIPETEPAAMKNRRPTPRLGYFPDGVTRSGFASARPRRSFARSSHQADRRLPDCESNRGKGWFPLLEP